MMSTRMNTDGSLVFTLSLCSASEWKVPTTFIYGYQDWMDYQGAQLARRDMKVPCEIIRVAQVSLFFSVLNSSFISLLITW